MALTRENLVGYFSSQFGVDSSALGDDDPLFGELSPVQLDSLDLIQISMAIYKTYGIKITDANEARRAFATINSLANEVQPA